jgi:hypothetical protein
MFGSESWQADSERMKWLFEVNPFRRGTPALWSFRKNGAIVATVAHVASELKVGEQQLFATWSIDGIVDPEVREGSIFHDFVLPTELVTERAGVQVRCSLGQSEDGYRFMMRRGYRDVAAMSAYVWVVNPRQVSESFAGFRPIKWCGRLTLSAFTLFARWICHVRARGARLLAIEEFDGRVEEVWAEASTTFQVATVRNLRWLRWRFDRCPQRDVYRRYYLTSSDRVVGYLVVRLATWRGRPVLSVIDYLAVLEHFPALAACAAVLAEEARATLLIWRTFHPRVRSTFRMLGYLRREDGHRLVVTVVGEDDVDRVVYDPQAWFLTAGDADLDELTSTDPLATRSPYATSATRTFSVG